MSDATDEYLPKAGEFDPLADDETTSHAGSEAASNPAPVDAETARPSEGKKSREKLIHFYTPSQLKAYEPPANQCLVGDYHLQRGAPSVLAGPAGCGKSRAALWLGIMGAKGAGNWLGMEVRSKFKTLMLQNENGMARLHRDMGDLPSLDGLDDYLRISAPPAYGLALQNPLFRAEMKAVMKDFAPNLLIVDPWNACVRDAMEKDFQEGFTRLREVLAESPNEPACLILHHLRKPKSDDRHKGRNLAHLLSGSYVLVSVARSVMVMQPATDDTEDARVVLTCAKNNDGELGARSAWERRAGLFEPVPEFDWESFDNGGTTHREAKVKEEHVRQAFDLGLGPLPMSQVVARLQELAGVGRSAAYDALKTGTGARFAHLLVRQPGTSMISLRPL